MSSAVELETWEPPQINAFAAVGDVLNVFERLGYAGFLLDPQRRVVTHNQFAEEQLGDGLNLNGAHVVATDRQSDMRLQALIEAALEPTTPVVRAASVGLRRDFRLPLVVRVLRLGPHAPPNLNATMLLLLVADPEVRQVPSPDILAELFRLTPSEASVAGGIAAGKQLAEIAAERGVKVETVRVHSKSVFSKTSTRGQTELAALLTRLAFLVPNS